MLDQRSAQSIDLANAEVLKENVAYKYTDVSTGKELVVKLIDGYDDEKDIILLTEFRKLALLSSEPEMATVYFLAKAKISDLEKSCYVMDYIYGYDLDEFINSHEHINYNVIFDIITQIASGLEKAHHYDIFHNDLHNKNIRINTLGYVKLIDFLWREYSTTKSINTQKDLTDFKRVVRELGAKCEIDMAGRMTILNDYCQSINSFTNLKITLLKLNDISFTLSLLGPRSLPILSKLLQSTKEIPIKSLLHSEEFIDEEVPPIYIATRTETQERYLQKNRETKKRQQQIERGELPAGTPTGVIFSDSLIPGIKNLIDFQLLILLAPIEKAGFIKFEADIVNKGEVLVGPYYLNCDIYFTPKFAELKQINQDIQILSIVEKDWMELILSTPIDELQDSLPSKAQG